MRSILILFTSLILLSCEKPGPNQLKILTLDNNKKIAIEVVAGYVSKVGGVNGSANVTRSGTNKDGHIIPSRIDKSGLNLEMTALQVNIYQGREILNWSEEELKDLQYVHKEGGYLIIQITDEIKAEILSSNEEKIKRYL